MYLFPLSRACFDDEISGMAGTPKGLRLAETQDINQDEIRMIDLKMPLPFLSSRHPEGCADVEVGT